MPVFLLKFATSLVGPKFAKPAIFAALAVFVLLALWGGKCAYDKSIIDRHEAKQEAATAKADRAADTKAAEQRRADDARLTQEGQQLKEAQADAKTNHDRSLARARCIRLQQSARAAKRQPPSCIGSGVPSGTPVAH